MVLRIGLGVLLCGAAAKAGAGELPGAYFGLIQTEIAKVEQALAAEPAAGLKSLEARPGWGHFPSALLVAAVLYSKAHPGNPRHGDARLLELALKIGDLLAAENEKGYFTQRGDHHRDLYMWLEAYRLLEERLEPLRRARWRREISKNVADLARSTAERADRAAYCSPFIGTSPNHFSLWASTVYLAARVFGNAEWEKLGARVLHRFAAEEQAPDGYWGEHDKTGPTAGYDYLTLAGVALYYEHSRDPAALRALRRSTDFHKYFTYPDGMPVELMDDRRRHVYVSPWGHFGFSHFPDGRRYAEFLTSFYRGGQVGLEHLGRIAQDALYYHEGPTAPIPLDQPRFAYQMSVPGGIRKTGPWVVCLSGLISTQAVTNQYFLDRQGSLSVFHEKLGLIITGGNSKRQPELATFFEKVGGRVYHMPVASRLRMLEGQDRLSLAYNTFFTDLEVGAPSGESLPFRFVISRKGRFEEAQLTLELRLEAGEVLETAAGRRITLGAEKIDLAPQDLGGWLRHHGWTLKTDARARLTWPVYPFNPYANGPDTTLENAVATLAVPLAPQASGQEISFMLEVGGMVP